MNSLSWFLYAADVIGSLNFFFGISGFVAGLAALALVVIGAIDRDCAYSEKEKEKGKRKQWSGVKLAPVGAVFIFLACLLPSKQTMYMIAASEIGDRLSKTQAANEIATEANDILRGYLKKLRAGLGEEKPK